MIVSRGNTSGGRRLPYGAGEFVYAPFSSSVVRETVSGLVSQFLPDADKYDLGVIDDTGGRLLGKVAMYALNQVRTDAGLSRAIIRFVADAHRLDRPERLWPDVPRNSVPLIVTDSIDYGSSVSSLIGVLSQAGFAHQTIGLVSVDVQDKRLEEKNRALFDQGIGRWYYLSSDRPGSYVGDQLREAARAGMNGVVQRGGPFAVRANLIEEAASDVPYLRAVREDCRVLARQIVADFVSVDNNA